MMTEPLLTLVSWIVAASWKGSILILLIAAVLWITRDRIPPRWRYVVGLVVLLRLAIPVAPASSVSLYNLFDLPGRPIAVVELRQLAPPPLTLSPVEAAPMAAEMARLRWDLLGLARIAGWIWLAGFLVLALRLSIAAVRLHRQLRREPRGEIAPAVLELLRDCRTELRIRREVALRDTDLARSPALHGILRPELLLPRGMTATFTAVELRFIFLHELAHLKRYDVPLNCVISLVQITHWFNPLVWLATLRLREERELACDELALSCLQQDERPDYGRTILKLLASFRIPVPVPALLGILNDKQQMKRRLLMITRFRSHRSSLLFLALVIALGAVSLTDARPGERMKVRRPLDPAAQVTIEKLDQTVSFELREASLSQILTELTGRTGVVFTQSADLPAEVGQRRITIGAEQVPAHAVLMETLSALDLGFDATAEGVSIGKARGIRRMMLLDHAEKPGAVFEKKIVKRHGEASVKDHDEIEIETNGTPEEAAEVFEVLEKGPEGGQKVDERIFIRKIDPAGHEAPTDGTIKRNLTFRRNENGVETRGTLRLEIHPAS